MFLSRRTRKTFSKVLSVLVISSIMLGYVPAGSLIYGQAEEGGGDEVIGTEVPGDEGQAEEVAEEPVELTVAPIVSTDKEDYSPGETVTITGVGFPALAEMRVEVERPDGSVVLGDGSFLPGSDSVMTGVNGGFVYKYQLNGIEGTYTVRVFDEANILLATKTFTDRVHEEDTCSRTSGAIWTTDSTCGAVNMNQYASKMDVYLNGGPDNGGNLPDGDYYVKVTTPNGDWLGDSEETTVAVEDGSFAECVNLYALTSFADTTNPGGVYKVWVSQDPEFPNRCSKTDNFKVEEEEEEVSYCGDGIVDDGEECDNGEMNGQSECSIDCTLEPMECVEGASWAGSVVEFEQGIRKDGTDVPPERSDPSLALGEADGMFVSLGFDGSLVIQYPGWATDGEGWDISVHEVTWGRMSYPDERAEVFVSQDGSDWVSVGMATNHYDGTGISVFDISPTGFDWVRYVKIVDATDPAPFGANGDGFDLDAIDVRYQVCEEPRVSDVEVCKVDGNRNPLSGWDVQLLGEPYEEVTVYPDGGVYASSSLPQGDYVLVASGTYAYRGGTGLMTDPNFSERLESDEYTGPYFPWINVNDFNSPHEGWLGIMVNSSATNWSDYLAGDHEYALGYEEYSGVFSFQIQDNYYYDNVGSLTVRIYEGWAGTTGEEGCVEFEGVPYGEYTVDETLRDGWINVSGLGDVEVDEDSERFVIQNRTPSGDLKVCKFEDKNANGVRDDRDMYIEWDVWVDGLEKVEKGRDGCYTWEDVPVGNYTVHEADREGWMNTTDNNGDTVMVNDEETTLVEFGNFRGGSIEGRKYEDMNGNGERDGRWEDWLSDWTIRLYDEEWEKQSEDVTDGGGWYYFDGLEKGTYYVCEVMKQDWVQTEPMLEDHLEVSLLGGGMGGLSHAEAFPNGSGDETEGMTCWKTVIWRSGQDNENLKFGNFEKGSIEGRKYEDMNMNGQRDGRWEPWLEGWTIRLYDEEWDNIQHDVTDEGGWYYFDGLDKGTYYVCEVMERNWVQTEPMLDGLWGDGQELTQIADPSIGAQIFGSHGGFQGPMAVPNMSDSSEEGMTCWRTSIRYSGQYNNDLKFGNYELGEIEGRKFHDVNGNGEWDRGERGLNSWFIRLYDEEWDNIEYDITWGWDGQRGWYFFDGLTPGRYHVCEVLQEGWTQSYPQLEDGAVPIMPDFDGEERDLLCGGGECEGSEMRAIPSENQSGEDNEGQVCWTTWIGRSGTFRGDLNFGNFETGMIDGYKIEDVNGDGELTEDEYGLEGWTIRLWTIGDEGRELVAETVTDENGYYSFGNLEPGEYYVTEVLQDGWVQTLPDTPAFGPLVIESGSSYHDITFGNFQLGMIQGRKYHDVNENGNFDPAEKNAEGDPNRLDGWTISLYDSDWMKVDEMETGDDATDAGDVGKGQYRFVNLEKGTYYVCEVLENGWYQTEPAEDGGFAPGEGTEGHEGTRCRRVRIKKSGQEKTGIQFGNARFGDLTIDKTNDSLGLELYAGDTVVYTLTVTAHENDLQDVVVYDVPPSGIYVWENTRELALSGITSLYGTALDQELECSDEEYGSDGYGIWCLGDMEAGEVRVLSYTAGISEEQQVGVYPDLAWARGVTESGAEIYAKDAISYAQDPDTDDTFVGTEVEVVALATAEAEVVLGTSSVLAETGQNILAIVLGALGLVLGSILAFIGFRRKKLVIVVSTVAVVGLTAMLGFAGDAAAGSMAISVQQPKSPTGNGIFVVSYVLSGQGLGEDIDVICQKMGPGESSWSGYDWRTFGSLGGNGDCYVDSSVVDTVGTYKFRIAAESGSVEMFSDEVSVVYDTVTPGAVTNYAKENVGTCTYKLTFRTADDGGRTEKVLVYRSQDTSFPADADTYVGEISVGSNTDVEYTDEAAGCTSEVYYAVFAVDSAGNFSTYVADTIVETVEVLPGQPGAPGTPAVPVEGGGEVAGEATGPEGEGAVGENGEVLGEEEVKDTDGDGIPDSEDEDADGNGIKDEDEKEEEDDTDAEKSRDIVRYVLIIGGGVILLGGAFAAFRFFSKPQA